jgi:peroxiredoxin Q/BCP
MGANPKVKVGDDAPDFEVEGHDGELYSRASFAGKRLVLYFYPKDNTPGCTSEACDFRDGLGELVRAGAVVVGVSPDSVGSHLKFRDKYDLPFLLLSDRDHALAEAYGVWREKQNYGRTYLGIVRSTFVVGADGKVEAVYDNVKAKGHVARLLGDL